jgi:hypothetical protein
VRTAGGIRAEIRADPAGLQAALAALPGVRKVELVPLGHGWQGCALRTDADHDARAAIAGLAAARRWPLRELGQEAVSLERVFAEITQAGEI